VPRFFSEGVYFVGSGVSTPRVLSSTRPEYTAEARAAGIEGAVQVVVTIGQDGVPRDARIHAGLGHGLDEMAIRCVAEWRFKPGEYEGNPVAVAATLNVSFQLNPWQPTDTGVWRVRGEFSDGDDGKEDQ
jgi:protein TonB